MVRQAALRRRRPQRHADPRRHLISDALLASVGSMTDFDHVLSAARNGNEDALAALYRSLYPRFVRYAGAVVPSSAEDVAADAWLDVARSLGRFQGDQSDFSAWAFTIVRRRLLDLRWTGARQ